MSDWVFGEAGLECPMNYDSLVGRVAFLVEGVPPVRPQLEATIIIDRNTSSFLLYGALVQATSTNNNYFYDLLFVFI
jgi:hypothetical protein